MSSITLTKKQHEGIIKDASGSSMLTPKQLELLASRVNAMVNIPYLNEEQEQKVLVKAVRAVDLFLYDQLPNEIYGLIKDASDGISQEEAERMSKRLAQIANERVNLPYLTEWMEQKIFEMLIGFILNAMVKGNKLAA